MSYFLTERLITETTRLTLGVALSPHLFRSCAATAIYTNAGDNPNIASADLQHITVIEGSPKSITTARAAPKRCNNMRRF
jgi:hypothetical protein